MEADNYRTLRAAVADARLGPHDRDLINRVEDLIDAADDLADGSASDFRVALADVLSDLNPAAHLDRRVVDWFASRGAPEFRTVANCAAPTLEPINERVPLT